MAETWEINNLDSYSSDLTGPHDHEERNDTWPGHNYTHSNGTALLEEDDLISYHTVQIMFSIIYLTIFILGIIGNVLVCYVVIMNRNMQTVTNFFITNLALADILLCALAVPFTPMYTFLQQWIFGEILCHLVAYAQGTSVYISTLTLTSIAIDRFCVIIYPFRPRMRLTTCFFIITSIWMFALLATLPYGVFIQYRRVDDKYECGEQWPSEKFRQIFSACTAGLQFIFPFLIMAFCYIRVSLKLSDRAKAKPGSKNSKREAVDRERKRRTNRMLIAMVAIFGVSWLPLNVVNFLNDIYIYAEDWRFYNLLFFLAHAVAMSSTCYNPFLYAWLNENFRKEFKQVLPCFYSNQTNGSTRTRRLLSERTCNGQETVQESFLPSTSQMVIGVPNSIPKGGGVLETIEEQTSNSNPTVAINYDQGTAKYNSNTNTNTNASTSATGAGAGPSITPNANTNASTSSNTSRNTNEVEIHIPPPADSSKPMTTSLLPKSSSTVSVTNPPVKDNINQTTQLV